MFLIFSPLYGKKSSWFIYSKVNKKFQPSFKRVCLNSSTVFTDGNLDFAPKVFAECLRNKFTIPQPFEKTDSQQINQTAVIAIGYVLVLLTKLFNYK